MPDFDSAALKRAVTDEGGIDQRDARALTEYMTVLPIGGDVYDVTTESGSSYRVDAREGRCTCPDHQYREVTCKHIRRVRYATGETSIPQWANMDAVDSHLGEHVDGQPRQVASDGGIIEAGDEGEILDGDDVDDSRPDDCQCADFLADADLPCWPCYRDGFENPNPEEIDDE